MSKQYDPTRVGQEAETLGGVHSSAVLAKLYTNIPAGSTAYSSDLGPAMFDGGAWSGIGGATPQARPFLDAKSAGITLNGTTDDYTAFNTLLTSIGTTPTTIILDGPMLIGTSITIPATVLMFYAGASKLKLGANVTVTHHASYFAGPRQVFDCSASGSIVTGLIKPLTHSGRVLTEHWGAVGDGSTDDSVAFQKTAKAATDAGFLGIQLLAKTYNTTVTVFARGDTGQSFNQPSWYGINSSQTIWNSPTIAAGSPALKFRGGSGQICHAVVQDIQFDGNATSIGIMFAGVCGVRAIRCKFDSNAEGIQFHNEDTGAFTEYCVADNCEFTNNCLTSVHYKKTSGNASCHGSGFANRCLVNVTNGTVITVDSGMQVYNAPLGVQVWAHGACTLIASAATSPVANFIGELTIEVNNSSSLTLATTRQVFFSGPVSANGSTTGTGGNILAGTFARVKTAVIHQDSSTSVTGFEKSYFTAMTTGANLIDSVLGTNNRLINLRFEGANYDYRYVLCVDHDGFGGNGYVSGFGDVTVAGMASVPAPYRALNTAAYGPPAFAVNTTGDLTATNSSWPASGVSCYWFEMSLSPGAQGASRQQF